MSYYFKTEKMSVGYRKKPLVEQIEFELEKGQILTLIGPNGAGKSTILKSIARQLELTGGTVWVDGKGLGQLSGEELSQRMAVVLTQRLHTELMTCEDVAATGRYPYTGRFGRLSQRDRRIVEEAMELVDITEIRDRDFTRISDGQRQRVMLARAICQEPEILVLDEPTSYLDVRYKLEFLSVLQRLQRQKGLTVIMSLHELELAARVSDKLLCVNGRYADRFGTPEQVFEPGYLSRLFRVETGSFEEESQSMELEAPRGEPETFVISGAGTGRMTYRRLQRQGVPFIAGILFENDLDYPAARALAVRVIHETAFEPVSAGTRERAREALLACRRVICCRESFGSLDRENGELLELARACGKEIEWVR